MGQCLSAHCTRKVATSEPAGTHACSSNLGLCKTGSGHVGHDVRVACQRATLSLFLTHTHTAHLSLPKALIQGCSLSANLPDCR